MRKSIFLPVFIIMIMAAVFSPSALAVVSSDESSPVLSFVDPSPADGAWINYSNPSIKIEADEELSQAYLQLDLLNGGFENSVNGYQFGGRMAWNLVNYDKHSGANCVTNSGSGNISYNDISSYMTRFVEVVEAGIINFWYKTDTEEGSDYLIFYINDVEQGRFSGENDWTEASFAIEAGNHELKWVYQKDESGSFGSDAIWIDDINIYQGPTREGLTMDILDDNKFAEYGLSDLDEGSYTYQVTAYDTAGNKTVSDARSFRIDTVAPSGHIWVYPYHHNKETAGDDVSIEVSLRDYDSYVKDVCLWLGDEEENLLDPDFDNCKELSEKTWNSYNYAPGFNFRNWDSSKVADGSYNLYAIAADNAGNEAKIFLFVKLNNHSEGSAENPSEISTCEEFQAINDNLNWHYKLMSDIDCSETKTWNYGKGFAGIGDSSHGFVGTLDGQNYHIYDIYQNQPGTNSGIFYSINGTVKNINFRNAEIKCNSTYCGAFTNYNTGIIEKSSITGSLQCSGKCGGFASQQSGTVSECWGDMTIGSGGYSGGIAGQNYAGNIKNSYFKGKLESSTGGGIVGLNESTGWGGGTIQNSFSNVEVNGGTWSKNGGLVGWMYQNGSQTGSYWNKEVSGLDKMCGINGTNCLDENGLSDEEMKTADSFEGWDFETIWAIDPEKNDGYPYLQWQTTFSEKDVNRPIITLNGEAELDIYVGEEYSDEGATAEDDVDGDISAEIVVNNPVDTSAAGSYIITYNVSDEAGNEAEEKTRTVNVITRPAPATPSSSSSYGGSPIIIESEPTPTVFQTYDPNTGVLTEKDDAEEENGDEQENDNEEEEEEIKILGVEMDFSDIDNLYGYPSDVVDAVSGDEAEIVFNSNDSVETEENISEINNKIVSESDLIEDELMSIAFFIQYGTKTTKRLGAGERAGVVDSFKSAYGRLPKSLSDWQDVIKIANGRWPEARNEEREVAVKREFVKIYLREADIENDFDQTAIMIMAYGLRPANRSMDSEKAAITIFKDIYGYYPKKASDWDAVRAIAYSGAER